MRAHFSIEWLAQSSLAAGSTSHSATLSSSVSAGDTSTSGTHPENLPGFYCQPRTEKPENQTSRGQGLEPLSNPSLAGPVRDTHSRRSILLHHTLQVSEMSGCVGVTDGEETSGYESEGGRSVSPTAPLDSTSTSPASPPGGRRPRTVYTEQQLNSLEVAFKKNAYLGTQEKAELCTGLNLTDKQIRNWFQNRRMRMKRMIQDALAHACQAKVASHLLHYPSYCPSPYPTCPPPHTVPEAGAPYLHTRYSSSSASPGLTSVPALESFYQYTNLPGLVVPTTGPNTGTVAYQTYATHY
ncbi:hypothetical protein UPYG_G00278060 [Umbra pygmaea]|uniref:Homeobox domain-containing protein n=1 Tax=Umbra pygmaea TaxID=75934 RepID=A0ABD0WKI3_UMBPY